MTAATDMAARGGLNAGVATSVVPQPPRKSASAWALDVLLWGGIALVLIVVAFNIFGDGLNDALDPYARRRS